MLPNGLPIPTNLAPSLFCKRGSVAWKRYSGPNPLTSMCSFTAVGSVVASGVRSLQMPALAMTRLREVTPWFLIAVTASAGSVGDWLSFFTRMRLLEGSLGREESFCEEGLLGSRTAATTMVEGRAR